MITKKYKYFVFVVFTLMLSGCIGLKHLKEDEKLLYRQGIQAPKEIDAEKLRELYTQKANRKILGLPISPLVGIYYWGARNYDQDKYIAKRDSVIKKFDTRIAKATSQKKINNYQFRKQKKVDKFTKKIEEGNLRMQWGEPVAVFDSTQVSLTNGRFHDYLFSKGYFNNKISSKIVTLGKLVSVTYKVEPGLPYFLDSIFYQINDSSIYKLIKADHDASLLKKGERYDQEKFTRERDRVDILLKNNGYYDFSRQYIEFEVDTTLRHERRVVVLFRIRDPAMRGYHKKFKVDSVIFITDAGLKKTDAKRSTKVYKNISFKAHKFNYNSKVLTQRVFITPGSIYSRDNTVTTQRQLSNLDNFKFVNINYDTSNGKFIANIVASPLDRYQWSNEIGVNVTQGYPGPFDNVNFRKRNVFHGLESFDLTGRFGFEGVASATKSGNIYRSTEAGINAALTFPQFLWLFREKTLLRLGRYNPKTKLSSGYSYSERPEYTRSTTSFNFNYSWEKAKTKRFDFTLANLNIINSTTSKKFDSLLNVLKDRGNNLYRSFNPSFVSSMMFGMTWNHNNYGNRDESSVYFRWQLESGGTLQNILTKSFIEKNGLQSYKYLRLNADLRKNIIVNKNTTLAYHLNGGVAYAYNKGRVLPYEKYYFVGGSNSIRAWRPRRLGQGSLKPSLSKDASKDGLFDYGFEKPGDILLEGSVEYRKHIFGFIEGAVFVDAGNVWYMFPQNITSTESSDPGDPQFKINSFYKQIGVGTGFGLRFDFTFLIIRFDVGMKVYDPAQEKFVLNRARFFHPYANEDVNGNYTNFKEPVIYNFGIGYPF